MSDRFAHLEQESRIEPITAGAGEVERLHALVDRDLATAERLRDHDRDWALAIAYNAMLQACHAVMVAYGYRSRGEQAHRTTIEFVKIAVPSERETLERLDRIRRKRHRAVYDVAGQTTGTEIEDALELARTLLPVLKATALRELRS